MINISKILLFYCIVGIVVIPFIVIPIVNSVIYYTYGNFQLYMVQNDSIGVQHSIDINNYYFEIESTTANTLNASAFIQQTETNGVLSFNSNINGSMELTTNINQIKVQINDIVYSVLNIPYSFEYYSGDVVKIIWRIGNPFYNFVIGLIGVALFIINPILSYKLTDNARDKFKFMFMLICIGFVSLGLALTFVYA